jgi:hypothetical protein
VVIAAEVRAISNRVRLFRLSGVHSHLLLRVATWVICLPFR